MFFERIHLLKKYFNFRLNSKPKGGHGIHSPFIYDLYTQVIDIKSKEPIFEEIEKIRSQLLTNHTSISKAEFGAGSKSASSHNETIGSIIKKSSIPAYFGQLLFRITNYLKPESIIELGTSAGISTMYLASGFKDSKVISIEGDSNLSKLASNNINNLGLSNVSIINGEFDSHLPGILNSTNKLGLVFIDGNHTLEATMRYFNLFASKADNDTLIIIDDIIWNHEMETAWKNICNDINVTISINLFNCGIVFFRKGVVKQHFNLRYGPF